MNLRSLFTLRWVYRAWYYFRLGYGTYLSFLLGFASTLVTVYYLAIRNMPFLLSLFPNFFPFAVLSTLVGVPLAVAVGWAHLKRSRIFSSEVDIAVEANPYYFKIAPGISKEVTTPAMLAELRILQRLAQAEGLLSDSEKAEIEELQAKLRLLLEGKRVGSPTTRVGF